MNGASLGAKYFVSALNGHHTVAASTASALKQRRVFKRAHHIEAANSNPVHQNP
jgi:hypothetical protein